MRLIQKLIFLVLFVTMSFGIYAENHKNSYFPLAKGNTWKYQMTSPQMNQPVIGIDTITGKETINGKETYIIESKTERNNFLNRKRYFRTNKKSLILERLTTFSIAQRGLTYGLKTIHKPGDIIENDDPYVPMTYLKYPLRKGKVWRSQDATFTVIDKETVTVPAGTFDCWKIELKFKGSQGTIYKYYAENVGLVKDETIDKNVPSISKLIEYKINNGS